MVLGKEQVEQAYQLKLGANVRACLENTPSFHDGRWLFIKASNAEDVADVEQLLALKRKPKKK